MKRINSSSTFFLKRVFPALWFGSLAMFLMIAVLIPSEPGFGFVFALIPLVMAIFGYFLFKALLFDLLDEVYDEGDSLLFRNSGQEVRVYLKDIKNVSYVTIMNPPRVTFSVRSDTLFGKDLSMAAPTTFIPFKKNEEVAELIERIDRARSN